MNHLRLPTEFATEVPPLIAKLVDAFWNTCCNNGAHVSDAASAGMTLAMNALMLGGMSHEHAKAFMHGVIDHSTVSPEHRSS